MKLLSDKEFKEIKEAIEMYKDNYNETLEDYYKLNKELKNLHELLIKFQSKNQKLRNKLEEKDKILNKAIKIIEKDMNSVWDDADYYPDDLLKILKGEE